MHRTTTVVMTGVCMLWLVLASSALANEFYQAGEAREIQGADNLGKTIVHYLVVLGLPMLSGGLMVGGLMRVKSNPGQGGAGIASGVGAGYVASIVGNLHTDAAASVSLGSLTGGLGWLAVVFSLLLQATLIACLVCYARGRFRDVEAL